jgi:hypothetical protein
VRNLKKCRVRSEPHKGLGPAGQTTPPLTGWARQTMRRILAALFLLSVAAFSQQATVTISLQNFSGQGVSKNAYVRAELAGCGSNVPAVNGVVLANAPDWRPDTSGNISTTIYRNDFISCAGSTATNYYVVSFYVNNNQVYSGKWRIAKPTFNPATDPQITTGSLPPAPQPPVSGARTYTCSQPLTASTWICTHNFGVADVVPVFYDLTSKQIYPDTVTETDTNTLTATFVTPQAGRALIINAGNFTPTVATPNPIISNPTGAQTINNGYDLNLKGRFLPLDDNTWDIGSSGLRWRDLWLGRNLSIGGGVSTNIIPTTDNALDIGSNSFRWRDGWFGRNLDVGGTISGHVNGTVNVKRYAASGAGTSGSPYTGWSSAITWSNDTTYSFEANLGQQTFYSYSSLPNLAKNGIHIKCEPGVVLNFTGTGDMMLFDGFAAVGSNAGVGNILVEGCILNGNANATNGIHTKDVHRSTFRDIRALNLTGAGVLVNGGVINHFDDIKVSSSGNFPTGLTQTTTPANCIKMSDDGTAMQATASTIYRPICEGTAGEGVYLYQNALANGTTSLTIIGGTIENNTGANGHGFRCTHATEITMIATDIESNSQRDVLLDGCGSVQLDNLYTTGTCEFKSNALNGETVMRGGICNSILVDNTFTGMIFDHAGYNGSGAGTFTDNGVSSTYRELYNIGAGNVLNSVNQSPYSLQFLGAQTIAGGTDPGFLALNGGKVTNAGAQLTLTGSTNANPGYAFLNAAQFQIRDLGALPKFTFDTSTLLQSGAANWGLKFTNMWAQNTAPTISSGFGTSPSIVSSNGTVAFTLNVGTGGTANNGVIGLPTATQGWTCSCSDLTTTSSTVFICKQTASSTTTATIGNFNTSGVAAAWAASDVLSVACTAR